MATTTRKYDLSILMSVDDNASKKLKGISATGVAFGTLMADAAKMAARALFDFSKETIKVASNMEETQSKFDVVFGKSAQNAEKWAKTLQKSYAMSELESKKYLSSVQDLLVPMGMQQTAAAALSNEIVKLSADLGSFNDMPTADVMMNIQSALTGMVIPMKKYGVIINQERIKQEAFNLGLSDGKKDLDSVTKALTSYSIMLNDSEAAIADMIRTSKSFANQSKFLDAGLEDLRITVGKMLLPAITELISYINGSVIPALADWLSDEERTTQVTELLIDAVRSLIQFIAVLPDSFQVAGLAAEYFWNKVTFQGGEAAAVYGNLQIALAKLEQKHKEVGAALVSDDEANSKKKQEIVDSEIDSRKKKLDDFVEKAKAGQLAASKEFQENVEKDTKFFTETWKKAGDTFATSFGNNFTDVILEGKDAWDALKNIGTDVVRKIVNEITTAMAKDAVKAFLNIGGGGGGGGGGGSILGNLGSLIGMGKAATTTTAAATSTAGSTSAAATATTAASSIGSVVLPVAITAAIYKITSDIMFKGKKNVEETKKELEREYKKMRELEKKSIAEGTGQYTRSEEEFTKNFIYQKFQTSPIGGRGPLGTIISSRDKEKYVNKKKLELAEWIDLTSEQQSKIISDEYAQYIRKQKDKQISTVLGGQQSELYKDFQAGIPNSTEYNKQLAMLGNLKNIMSFDNGGRVPGIKGSPRLVLVHGGETIYPTHKTGIGGMRPLIVNVTGNYILDKSSAQELAQVIGDVIYDNLELERAV